MAFYLRVSIASIQAAVKLPLRRPETEDDQRERDKRFKEGVTFFLTGLIQFLAASS